MPTWQRYNCLHLKLYLRIFVSIFTKHDDSKRLNSFDWCDQIKFKIWSSYENRMHTKENINGKQFEFLPEKFQLSAWFKNRLICVNLFNDFSFFFFCLNGRASFQIWVYWSVRNYWNNFFSITFILTICP